MLALIARRLAQAVPVLLGISFLVVLSARLVPGSPGRAYLGEKASAKDIERLDRAIGWYDPVPVVWARYLRGLAGGDLGRSFRTQRPIAQDLRERVPATAELALAAMLFAVPIGVGIGVAAAAARRGVLRLLDYAATAIALVGISLPVFWLGLLLQIYVYPTQQRLAPHLDLEPVTGLYTIDALLRGDGALFQDAVRHLALPALALGTIPLAVITRMTRSAMLDVLGSDLVRTARAKGLGPIAVALRHALRNALVPIITVIGLQLAALLGGAVLTESVFQWPGLGTYIVDAAQAKDLPALQGAVLVTACVFVGVNLAVDLCYALLDPRIRLGGSGR